VAILLAFEALDLGFVLGFHLVERLLVVWPGRVVGLLLEWFGISVSLGEDEVIKGLGLFLEEVQVGMDASFLHFIAYFMFQASHEESEHFCIT
jgi:hypothetical protein